MHVVLTLYLPYIRVWYYKWPSALSAQMNKINNMTFSESVYYVYMYMYILLHMIPSKYISDALQV